MVVAVVALEEGVFHALHRQVQAPILTVDRDVHITAQGGGGTEGAHHPIGEVVLHQGGVLDEVVQAQFVQTVVGLGAVILVELQLETVPVAAHGGHAAQRGVALGADAHGAAGLAVDDHGAHGVFLILAGVDESLPIVHDDVDGVDPVGVEQTGLVPHGGGGGLDAKGRAVHKDDAQEQGKQRGRGTDAVNVLVSCHGRSLSPGSRRCSSPARRWPRRAYRPGR